MQHPSTFLSKNPGNTLLKTGRTSWKRLATVVTIIAATGFLTLCLYLIFAVTRHLPRAIPSTIKPTYSRTQNVSTAPFQNPISPPYAPPRVPTPPLVVDPPPQAAQTPDTIPTHLEHSDGCTAPRKNECTTSSGPESLILIPSVHAGLGNQLQSFLATAALAKLLALPRVAVWVPPVRTRRVRVPGYEYVPGAENIAACEVHDVGRFAEGFLQVRAPGCCSGIREGGGRPRFDLVVKLEFKERGPNWALWHAKGTFWARGNASGADLLGPAALEEIYAASLTITLNRTEEATADNLASIIRENVVLRDGRTSCVVIANARDIVDPMPAKWESSASLPAVATPRDRRASSPIGRQATYHRMYHWALHSLHPSASVTGALRAWLPALDFNSTVCVHIRWNEDLCCRKERKCPKINEMVCVAHGSRVHYVPISAFHRHIEELTMDALNGTALNSSRPFVYWAISPYAPAGVRKYFRQLPSSVTSMERLVPKDNENWLDWVNIFERYICQNSRLFVGSADSSWSETLVQWRSHYEKQSIMLSPLRIIRGRETHGSNYKS